MPVWKSALLLGTGATFMILAPVLGLTGDFALWQVAAGVAVGLGLVWRAHQ